MTKKAKTRFRIIITLIAFTIGAIIMLIPFISMVFTSLKTDEEVLQKPLQIVPPTLEQYKLVLEEMSLSTYYFNSAVVVSSIVLFTLIISSMAGYAFAKYRFPGRDVLFILLLSTVMIPFQIIMFPLYIVLKFLGGIDTRWGLMVPHLGSAFGTFLMRQYIQSIPDELLDSARLDGSSEFGLYWRIILPLCKPALAVLVIFIFFWAWNDFLWPLLVVQSASKRTVALLVEASPYYSLDHGCYWGPIMVLALFMVAPVLAVFIFFQKYVIKGVVLSGFK